MLALRSVLVVVVAVGRVAVPVVGVVQMAAMWNRFVPAIRPMGMCVAGVRDMGQRVLIVMPLVWTVCVTIVDIVGVAFALDAGMSAAGSVVMHVRGVDLVIGAHGSSLLCCTASATMWAMCWSARE